MSVQVKVLKTTFILSLFILAGQLRVRLFEIMGADPYIKNGTGLDLGFNTQRMLFDNRAYIL